MLSKVLSASFVGVEGYIIEVETDISSGLPIFNIVGLGDMAISESKERVKAGIKNSGYEFNPKRIVVNLSPAHIRKEGSSFDLSIALGILISMGIVSSEKAKDYVILGELGLGGQVNRVTGIINAVITAKENNIKGIVVPYEKAKIPKKTMKAMDKADKENTIVDMYVNGHSFEDIMAVSGYSSRSSVFSVLHRHGVKLNRGKFSGPLGTRKKKKDDSPAEE